MVERVDFYSQDEYEQAIALEENWYQEEQAKREYEEQYAYQEYLKNNKVNKRYVDYELVEKSLSQKIIEVNQNAVIKHLEGGLIVATEVIRKLPTEDVIPVVRCKDCIYFKHSVSALFPKTNCFVCDFPYGMKRNITETDFCSYGEREEDNAK